MAELISPFDNSGGEEVSKYPFILLSPHLYSLTFIFSSDFHFLKYTTAYLNAMA